MERRWTVLRGILLNLYTWDRRANSVCEVDHYVDMLANDLRQPYDTIAHHVQLLVDGRFLFCEETLSMMHKGRALARVLADTRDWNEAKRHVQSKGMDIDHLPYRVLLMVLEKVKRERVTAEISRVLADEAIQDDREHTLWGSASVMMGATCTHFSVKKL